MVRAALPRGRTFAVVFTVVSCVFTVLFTIFNPLNSPTVHAEANGVSCSQVKTSTGYFVDAGKPCANGAGRCIAKDGVLECQLQEASPEQSKPKLQSGSNVNGGSVQAPTTRAEATQRLQEVQVQLQNERAILESVSQSDSNADTISRLEAEAKVLQGYQETLGQIESIAATKLDPNLGQQDIAAFESQEASLGKKLETLGEQYKTLEAQKSVLTAPTQSGQQQTGAGGQGSGISGGATGFGQAIGDENVGDILSPEELKKYTQKIQDYLTATAEKMYKVADNIVKSFSLTSQTVSDTAEYAKNIRLDVDAKQEVLRDTAQGFGVLKPDGSIDSGKCAGIAGCAKTLNSLINESAATREAYNSFIKESLADGSMSYATYREVFGGGGTMAQSDSQATGQATAGSAFDDWQKLKADVDAGEYKSTSRILSDFEKVQEYRTQTMPTNVSKQLAELGVASTPDPDNEGMSKTYVPLEQKSIEGVAKLSADVQETSKSIAETVKLQQESFQIAQKQELERTFTSTDLVHSPIDGRPGYMLPDGTEKYFESEALRNTAYVTERQNEALQQERLIADLKRSDAKEQLSALENSTKNPLEAIRQNILEGRSDAIRELMRDVAKLDSDIAKLDSQIGKNQLVIDALAKNHINAEGLAQLFDPGREIPLEDASRVAFERERAYAMLQSQKETGIASYAEFQALKAQDSQFSQSIPLDEAGISAIDKSALARSEAVSKYETAQQVLDQVAGIAPYTPRLQEQYERFTGEGGNWFTKGLDSFQEATRAAYETIRLSGATVPTGSGWMVDVAQMTLEDFGLAFLNPTTKEFLAQDTRSALENAIVYSEAAAWTALNVWTVAEGAYSGVRALFAEGGAAVSGATELAQSAPIRQLTEAERATEIASIREYQRLQTVADNAVTNAVSDAAIAEQRNILKDFFVDKDGQFIRRADFTPVYDEAGLRMRAGPLPEFVPETVAPPKLGVDVPGRTVEGQLLDASISLNRGVELEPLGQLGLLDRTEALYQAARDGTLAQSEIAAQARTLASDVQKLSDTVSLEKGLDGTAGAIARMNLREAAETLQNAAIKAENELAAAVQRPLTTAGEAPPVRQFDKPFEFSEAGSVPCSRAMGTVNTQVAAVGVLAVGPCGSGASASSDTKLSERAAVVEADAVYNRALSELRAAEAKPYTPSAAEAARLADAEKGLAAAEQKLAQQIAKTPENLKVDTLATNAAKSDVQLARAEVAAAQTDIRTSALAERTAAKSEILGRIDEATAALQRAEPGIAVKTPADVLALRAETSAAELSLATENAVTAIDDLKGIAGAIAKQDPFSPFLKTIDRITNGWVSEKLPGLYFDGLTNGGQTLARMSQDFSAVGTFAENNPVKAFQTLERLQTDIAQNASNVIADLRNAARNADLALEAPALSQRLSESALSVERALARADGIGAELRPVAIESAAAERELLASQIQASAAEARAAGREAQAALYENAAAEYRAAASEIRTGERLPTPVEEAGRFSDLAMAQRMTPSSLAAEPKPMSIFSRDFFAAPFEKQLEVASNSFKELAGQLNPLAQGTFGNRTVFVSSLATRLFGDVSEVMNAYRAPVETAISISDTRNILRAPTAAERTAQSALDNFLATRGSSAAQDATRLQSITEVTGEVAAQAAVAPIVDAARSVSNLRSIENAAQIVGSVAIMSEAARAELALSGGVIPTAPVDSVSIPDRLQDAVTSGVLNESSARIAQQALIDYRAAQDAIAKVIDSGSVSEFPTVERRLDTTYLQVLRAAATAAAEPQILARAQGGLEVTPSYRSNAEPIAALGPATLSVGYVAGPSVSQQILRSLSYAVFPSLAYVGGVQGSGGVYVNRSVRAVQQPTAQQAPASQNRASAVTESVVRTVVDATIGQSPATHLPGFLSPSELAARVARMGYSGLAYVGSSIITPAESKTPVQQDAQTSGSIASEQTAPGDVGAKPAEIPAVTSQQPNTGQAGNAMNISESASRIAVQGKTYPIKGTAQEAFVPNVSLEAIPQIVNKGNKSFAMLPTGEQIALETFEGKLWPPQSDQVGRFKLAQYIHNRYGMKQAAVLKLKADIIKQNASLDGLIQTEPCPYLYACFKTDAQAIATVLAKLRFQSEYVKAVAKNGAIYDSVLHVWASPDTANGATNYQAHATRAASVGLKLNTPLAWNNLNTIDTWVQGMNQGEYYGLPIYSAATMHDAFMLFYGKVSVPGITSDAVLAWSRVETPSAAPSKESSGPEIASPLKQNVTNSSPGNEMSMAIDAAKAAQKLPVDLSEPQLDSERSDGELFTATSPSVPGYRFDTITEVTSRGNDKEVKVTIQKVSIADERAFIGSANARKTVFEQTYFNGVALQAGQSSGWTSLPTVNTNIPPLVEKVRESSGVAQFLNTRTQVRFDSAGWLPEGELVPGVRIIRLEWTDRPYKSIVRPNTDTKYFVQHETHTKVENVLRNVQSHINGGRGGAYVPFYISRNLKDETGKTIVVIYQIAPVQEISKHAKIRDDSAGPGVEVDLLEGENQSPLQVKASIVLADAVKAWKPDIQILGHHNVGEGEAVSKLLEYREQRLGSIVSAPVSKELEAIRTVDTILSREKNLEFVVSTIRNGGAGKGMQLLEGMASGQLTLWRNKLVAPGAMVALVQNRLASAGLAETAIGKQIAKFDVATEPLSRLETIVTSARTQTIASLPGNIVAEKTVNGTETAQNTSPSKIIPSSPSKTSSVKATAPDKRSAAQARQDAQARYPKVIRDAVKLFSDQKLKLLSSKFSIAPGANGSVTITDARKKLEVALRPGTEATYELRENGKARAEIDFSKSPAKVVLLDAQQPGTAPKYTGESSLKDREALQTDMASAELQEAQSQQAAEAERIAKEKRIQQLMAIPSEELEPATPTMIIPVQPQIAQIPYTPSEPLPPALTSGLTRSVRAQGEIPETQRSGTPEAGSQQSVTDAQLAEARANASAADTTLDKVRKDVEAVAKNVVDKEKAVERLQLVIDGVEEAQDAAAAAQKVVDVTKEAKDALPFVKKMSQLREAKNDAMGYRAMSETAANDWDKEGAIGAADAGVDQFNAAIGFAEELVEDDAIPEVIRDEMKKYLKVFIAKRDIVVSALANIKAGNSVNSKPVFKAIDEANKAASNILVLGLEAIDLSPEGQEFIAATKELKKKQTAILTAQKDAAAAKKGLPAVQKELSVAIARLILVKKAQDDALVRVADAAAKLAALDPSAPSSVPEQVVVSEDLSRYIPPDAYFEPDVPVAGTPEIVALTPLDLLVLPQLELYAPELLAEAGPTSIPPQIAEEVTSVPSTSIIPSSPAKVAGQLPQPAQQAPQVVANVPVQTPVQPAQQSPATVPSGNTSATPGQTSQSGQTSGSAPSQAPAGSSKSGDASGEKETVSGGMPPIDSPETPLRIPEARSSFDTLVLRLLLLLGLQTTPDLSDESYEPGIQPLLDRMPLNQLGFDYSLLPRTIAIDPYIPTELIEEPVTAQTSDKVVPSSPPKTEEKEPAPQTPQKAPPAEQQTPPQPDPKKSDCVINGEIDACPDSTPDTTRPGETAPGTTPDKTTPEKSVPDKPADAKSPTKTAEQAPPARDTNSSGVRSGQNGGFNLQSLLAPLTQLLARLLQQTPPSQPQTNTGATTCTPLPSPTGACDGTWQATNDVSGTCPTYWKCISTRTGSTSAPVSSSTPVSTSADTVSEIAKIASPPPQAPAPTPTPVAAKPTVSKAVTNALNALTLTSKDIAPFGAGTTDVVSLGVAPGHAPPSLKELWGNLLNGLTKFLNAARGSGPVTNSQVLVTTDLAGGPPQIQNTNSVMAFLQSVTGFLQAFLRPTSK